LDLRAAVLFQHHQANPLGGHTRVSRPARANGVAKAHPGRQGGGRVGRTLLSPCRLVVSRYRGTSLIRKRSTP